MPAPVVILGCGFLGAEVARRAASQGRPVVVTVRAAEGHRDLMGVAEVHVRARLDRDSVAELVGAQGVVVVAFPPDPETNREIAPALVRAASVVYVSTTGIYGQARGRVDESTPVDASEPRAAARLQAEDLYREAGATVVRPAGIYGPGRGLHRRLLAGDFRIPGDGSNVVSRIHVADLARVVLALLDRSSSRGATFVAADDAPVPQIDAIAWLCRRLGVPLPPSAPIGEVAATLRHDRAVDNARIKSELSLTLEYPTYREGFAACLRAEGVSLRD